MSGSVWNPVGWINTAFAEFINFLQRGVGAVVRTVAEKLYESVSVLDFGADPSGVNDSSAAFSLAIATGRRVYVPTGRYKFNSSVQITRSVYITGDGVASIIDAYGCDAFTVVAGVSFISIEKFSGFSYTSGGAADPRTFDFIVAQGTAGSNVNFLFAEKLYLQGFADAVTIRYTWNSAFKAIDTVNCNNGIQLIGSCVNNTISSSRLVVNSGIASINILQDGANKGEGLMVSNCLLSAGSQGVKVTGGFLSLHLSNNVIDLTSGEGILATDCQDLRVTNNWIYSAGSCIKLVALSVAAVQRVSIIGNGLRSTGAATRVVDQGSNNQGLTFIGNSLEFSGTTVGIYLDGQSSAVDSNYFNNTGAGTSIVLNGSAATHKIGKNSGVATISGGFGTPDYSEGTWVPTDQSGAGLTLTYPTGACNYVKIGKLVTCHLDIQFPATANASVARILLPFTTLAGSSQSGTVGFEANAGNQISVQAAGGTNNFVFVNCATGAILTNAGMTGERVMISFSFIAST